MKVTLQKLLPRLITSYLIAAGVVTVALIIVIDPRHVGIGPFVFGAIFLFWAAPFMLMFAFFNGAFTGQNLSLIAIFVAAFVTVMFVFSLREASRRKLGEVSERRAQ